MPLKKRPCGVRAGLGLPVLSNLLTGQDRQAGL
jgi:hypothetical protein